VEVGSGSVVGVDLVMEHAKENHPNQIRSIGISTGWEETGRWEISNIEGNALCYLTQLFLSFLKNYIFRTDSFVLFRLP
jgi:hypothetical protein